jgi:hypothetical protein
MRTRTFALAAALAALAGCVAPAQPYVLKTPFSTADFQPYVGTGPATLHGQAFMKTVGGDVKTCAGQTVYLMPDNAYNAEIVQAPTRNFANRDARGDAYTRQTVCDAQGNFEFDNVPAKMWWVLVDVTWGVPNQYGSVDTQGGTIQEPVILQPGENKQVFTQ